MDHFVVVPVPCALGWASSSLWPPQAPIPSGHQPWESGKVETKPIDPNICHTEPLICSAMLCIEKVLL